MNIKNVVRSLVTNAVADQVIRHVAESAPREPLVHENPPRVSGWKLHNIAGHEPSWSAPPWSGVAEREYTSKMNAIAFALRHQLLEHDQAIKEHRKIGEIYEFTSSILPGDLHSLPKSIAADARRLLKAEGWV